MWPLKQRWYKTEEVSSGWSLAFHLGGDLRLTSPWLWTLMKSCRDRPARTPTRKRAQSSSLQKCTRATMSPACSNTPNLHTKSHESLHCRLFVSIITTETLCWCSRGRSCRIWDVTLCSADISGVKLLNSELGSDSDDVQEPESVELLEGQSDTSISLQVTGNVPRFNATCKRWDILGVKGAFCTFYSAETVYYISMSFKGFIRYIFSMKTSPKTRPFSFILSGWLLTLSLFFPAKFFRNLWSDIWQYSFFFFFFFLLAQT